jgi:hypothetical protein
MVSFGGSLSMIVTWLEGIFAVFYFQSVPLITSLISTNCPMGKNYVALNEVVAWHGVLTLSEFITDPPTLTPIQLPPVFTHRNILIFTFRVMRFLSHRALVLAHYEQAIYEFVKERGQEAQRYVQSRKDSEI